MWVTYRYLNTFKQFLSDLLQVIKFVHLLRWNMTANGAFWSVFRNTNVEVLLWFTCHRRLHTKGSYLFHQPLCATTFSSSVSSAREQTRLDSPGSLKQLDSDVWLNDPQKLQTADMTSSSIDPGELRFSWRSCCLPRLQRQETKELTKAVREMIRQNMDLLVHVLIKRINQ